MSQCCFDKNKNPQKRDKIYTFESLGRGASVHNGLMKNSGFIGSYTHFSLAHLSFIQFLPIM